MRHHLLILASLLVAACHGDSDHSGEDTLDTLDTLDDTGVNCEDLDGDGWCVEEDCDDSSASVFPGADEVCNGIDDDCDQEIDEDPPSWYRDDDLDGFGDPATEARTCDPDEGWVATSGDCDDADTHTYPGAPELCDGLRNDCDLTEWKPSHEDGEVAWFDGSKWERVTDTYARGSVDLPAYIVLEESGLLQFCEGTYYLRMVIKESDVELVGLYEAESTVLDAAGTGKVVGTTTGDLAVRSLTITGGAIEGGTGYGSGVYVRTGHVEVSDSMLLDNEGWKGGGLYLYGGNALVERSVISGNTAWEDGGGIGVDFGDLLVSNSTISGNTSGDNGGGLHVYEGELTLENSRLYRNSATGKGGGAAVHEGLLTVSGSTLLENLAYGGGGVSLDTGDLEVLESTFESNTTTDARGSGGGAYLRTGDAVIEGATFQSNKTGASGNGGGVYLDEGTASISTSTFSANTAGFAGGGVNVEDGTIYMEYSLFEENTAGVGGGVFVETGTLSCTGYSSVTAGFERNQATYFGGGVAIYLQPELDSVACDWGTGTNDNWPDDLTLGEDDVLEVSGLGDDETFTCDAKGCE